MAKPKTIKGESETFMKPLKGIVICVIWCEDWSIKIQCWSSMLVQAKVRETYQPLLVRSLRK